MDLGTCVQITMCRSEQNANLGLEVQLHIPDVLIPALSEPGMYLTSVTGVVSLFVANFPGRCDDTASLT